MKSLYRTLQNVMCIIGLCIVASAEWVTCRTRGALIDRVIFDHDVNRWGIIGLPSASIPNGTMQGSINILNISFPNPELIGKKDAIIICRSAITKRIMGIAYVHDNTPMGKVEVIYKDIRVGKGKLVELVSDKLIDHLIAVNLCYEEVHWVRVIDPMVGGMKC